MGLDVILIQFFQITILTFATFSIILLFLLLIKPDLFEMIARSSNITISSQPFQNQLEAQRDTDKKIQPHLRKISVFIIIVASLSLNVLLHNKGVFHVSNYVKTGSGSEWLIGILIQSTAWFFYIFLSISIIFGIIILVMPKKFPTISLFFNQWISTQSLYKKMDLFNNFDSFFMKYRLIVSSVGLFILSYVIYACFIRYL